ncbi:MAG: VRR-NUC domain-containing protein [Verrucomicrobia bacterium]|nr:VRR-NUC domain-containing protein [Verrucomicrobiota bacterium]
MKKSAVSREAELHEEIFDECRRRGWIALHGSMAERTCRTLGEPDFVILADRGRVLFVECKTRTGKLSPAQVALKHHAEKLGHTVHVVRSMEDFLKLL